MLLVIFEQRLVRLSDSCESSYRESQNEECEELNKKLHLMNELEVSCREFILSRRLGLPEPGQAPAPCDQDENSHKSTLSREIRQIRESLDKPGQTKCITYVQDRMIALMFWNIPFSEASGANARPTATAGSAVPTWRGAVMSYCSADNARTFS